MTPAPHLSAPDTNALRKQLILAQVQIMELEDLRDELHNALRAAIEQRGGLADPLSQAQEGDLAERLRQAQEVIVARDRTLADIHGVLATLRNRIEELAAERLALKASRSWRWTAPLRSVERLFSRRGGQTD